MKTGIFFLFENIHEFLYFSVFRLRALLGYTEKDFSSLPSLYHLIHPEDSSYLARAHQECMIIELFLVSLLNISKSVEIYKYKLLYSNIH